MTAIGAHPTQSRHSRPSGIGTARGPSEVDYFQSNESRKGQHVADLVERSIVSEVNS